jgi:hypothetical protein
MNIGMNLYEEGAISDIIAESTIGAVQGYWRTIQLKELKAWTEECIKPRR